MPHHMVEIADILLSPLKGRMCLGKKELHGSRLSILNENRKLDHPTDSISLLFTALVSPSKTDFLPFSFTIFFFFEHQILNDLLVFHDISTFLNLFTKIGHYVFVGLFGICFSTGRIESHLCTNKFKYFNYP